MLLKELAPPTLTPAPLHELSAHLRLAQGFTDDGSEDALLELYLRNATAIIESRTSRALVDRPYILQVGCWDRDGYLRLPVGPVAAIDSIDLIAATTTINLSPEEWLLEPGTQRQRVTGSGARRLRTLPAGGVAELRFTAGYGPSWNQVPDDLRQAVLLTAAFLYENRDGETEADAGLPQGLASILRLYTPVRL